VSALRGYKALKGMQDVLPPDSYLWQDIEQTAEEIFSVYGFRPIRPPIAEATELFTRSIGEDTDIVEKEMYTFNDKAGRSITLRPEGTASVVRSYIEHHLYTRPSPQKYYYSGPMFRYERPQSGRLRQFYQIGAEVFGASYPWMDAEMLSMLRHFLERLELKDLSYQINSIGCEQCRPAYKTALLDFFSDKREDLCVDCKRRYAVNPLRILDCKVEKCVSMRKKAPRVTDHHCRDCADHFERFQSSLTLLGVPYQISPEMVRGLDYYTRTIFEVTSRNLGAQNAVVAGGRYDNLVKDFGGPDTPAIGFAAGMERIVGLLNNSGTSDIPAPHAFISLLGEKACRKGIVIADNLRAEGFCVELGDPEASLKSQMRRADKLSARYVFVIGDKEIESGDAQWKQLSDASQGIVSLSRIHDFLADRVGTQ
jgi:histidyl-tRNA synthetase